MKTKLHSDNVGSMDLDGVVREPGAGRGIRGLSAKDVGALRNFVRNNRYALDHIADNDIWIYQIWPDMIKGGSPASEEAICALNAKVDKIMAEQEKEE